MAPFAIAPARLQPAFKAAVTDLLKQGAAKVGAVFSPAPTPAPAPSPAPDSVAPPDPRPAPLAPMFKPARGYGLFPQPRTPLNVVTQQVDETRQLAIGAAVTDKLATKLKAIMATVTPEQVQQMMRAHYQQMRLMDAQGHWLVKVPPSLLDPVDVPAFIDRVAQAIKNNPYLLSFLADTHRATFAQLEAKLASEGASVLPAAIAYAVVQDRLTKAMYDDPNLLEACTKHWERQASGDSLSKMRVGARVKLASVRWPVHEIIKAHHDKAVPAGFPRDSLPINIAEATVVDVARGFAENAIAGAVLMEAYHPLTPADASTGSQPSTFAADGKGIELGVPLPKEWADLYGSWNMAFVAQNARSFPFIIGKLLNPQVNDYTRNPRLYMYNRVIALQAHLYFMAFGALDGKQSETIDWRDADLGLLWSKANARAAEAFRIAFERASRK